MKNVMKSTDILYTGSHKSFSEHYCRWEEIFKAYCNNFLPLTKYNEIIFSVILHSDVQKHISYTKLHKRFVIYYDYAWKWLEIYFKLY